MRDDDWRALDDDALERLLVERWLYRGLMLGVMLLAAVLVTWLASRGVDGTGEWVTVLVVIAVALAAASVSLVMRQQDRGIHRELRRRRGGGGGA